IDHCVPEFRRIVGHVQHDQYHRFSVDAHILQALRELHRLRSQPKKSGKLRWIVKDLSQQEWEVLAFACLFHDIAKGRDGDHSENGVEIAASDLGDFGKSESFISDVCWIVKEHLALSAAAFRENPKSPRTWNSLAEKGVQGKRLRLLAAFTIVDIRATNPDAWTPWKETLLDELVRQLERPETNSLISFATQLRKNRLDPSWSERLEPFLIAAVPMKHLIDDIRSITKSTDARKRGLELEPRVVQAKGQTWVRFHSATDRSGLFLSYVSRLAASGLSVRHASIHTDSDLGVYDWFEVKTSKTAAQVKKLLETASESASPRRFAVRFDSIDLISQSDDEWVISFRGQDQQGALFEAARVLFEHGFQIRWSKVHTWGRQIDDVFGVFPRKDDDTVDPNHSSNQFIERLKSALSQPKAALATTSVSILKRS
ncbi:MAG TPA: HD domain-containing protein, partial [Bdellovibrionales bacterium]|nr:HD domain-containing protein [Bdellovibrionales bacterium]